MVRPAEQKDVPRMVALSGQKRREYAAYEPTFWREAADSDAKQLPFLQSQLTRANTIALVHERGGMIDGFVIATLQDAPPVYDPAGLTCGIDDFVVADAQEWPTVGKALLAAVWAQAKARGAVQSVVVCGHLDRPKREMLAALGCRIASEWYVRNL